MEDALRVDRSVWGEDGFRVKGRQSEGSDLLSSQRNVGQERRRGEEKRSVELSIEPFGEYIQQDHQNPISRSDLNIIQPSFPPWTYTICSYPFDIAAGPSNPLSSDTPSSHS